MPAPMPLRPTTVRFAEDAMDLVQKASKEAGVSMGQFVREAAIMRAAALLPREIPMDIERLARNYED
jgi:uncharacterized protein (DUF1778 family)